MSWADIKFNQKTPPPDPVNAPTPSHKPIPKKCQYNHQYRTFDIFALDSLFGGVSGHASNRELSIRLEERFPDCQSLSYARTVMRDRVDTEIAARGLDIPPYTERVLQGVGGGEWVSQTLQRLEENEEKNKVINQSHEIVAIQGLQAERLMYSTCLPMKLVGELFNINLKDVPTEERYQRSPSGARVRKIKDYVLENPSTYILPSLTASLEGDWEFTLDAPRSRTGILHLEAGVLAHLLDGSHRKEAIAQAIKDNPELIDEDICVMFVGDRGLEQRRQWFSDINLTPVKPPKAMSLNYNGRDREGNFNKQVIAKIPLFSKYTVTDKGTAGGKGSNKLFVLTWLHDANKTMRPGGTYQQDVEFCVTFWKLLIELIPAWQDYDPTKDNPAKVREQICCHAIALKAFAKIGAQLGRVPKFMQDPKAMEAVLRPLSEVDWEKDSPHWEGVIVEKTADKRGDPKYRVLTKNVDKLVAHLKAVISKGGKKIS